MNIEAINTAIDKLGDTIDYLDLRVQEPQKLHLSIHRDTIILYPEDPYEISIPLDGIPQKHVKAFKSKGGTISKPRTGIDPFTKKTTTFQGGAYINFRSSEEVKQFVNWFFAEIWGCSQPVSIDGWSD
jgi:hypothetical protein